MREINFRHKCSMMRKLNYRIPFLEEQDALYFMGTVGLLKADFVSKEGPVIV